MPKKKSNEELTLDIKNLDSKIKTLEKYMNDERKQKETWLNKLEKSFNANDSLIKSIQIELKSTNTTVNEKFTEQEKLLKKTVDEFNKFKKELETELDKVAEKDQIMEDLRSKIKEQDILLSEKDKNLNKLEKQFEETLEKHAKLKTEYDSLKVLYDQTTTLKDELKKDLATTQQEYSDFKAKEEPARAQNESIRLILNSTDQGKIYLVLVDAFPKSMTIDEIAEITDSTAVVTKSALLSLEELGVVDFNPATREVKLSE